jgi:hypothetical protein
MLAWLLLAAGAAVVGALTIARLARVRKLSQPTVADPERVGEELLEYVSRQGRRVVDLRPFWNAHRVSEADRWAIQGPLHQSGRLIDADEATSFLGRIRAYVRAPLPEHVVLAK